MKKNDNKVDKSNNSILNKKSNRLYLNMFLLLAFTIALFFITIEKVETKRINVKLGDAAPLEIRATKDIVDKHATEQLKIEAANRVESRYRISPSVQMGMKSSIKNFINLVKEIKLDDSMGINKKTDILVDESRIPLSRSEYQTALKMDIEKLDGFENLMNDIINQIMGVGIKEEDLEYEKANVEKIFESIDETENNKKLGISLINSTIQPNKFIDEEATQKRMEEEVAKVESVIIKEHQIIVRKGDIIDRNVLDIIKELGLLKEEEGYDRKTVLGVIILILLFESMAFGYIYYFNPEVLYENKLLILLIILISIVLISQGIYNISPYIMPISAGALLIAILLDIRLSLTVNLFLVLILGFVLKLEDTLVTMYLVGGSLGAFLVIKQHQRYNIIINGLLIGISNFLTVLSFGIIKKLEFAEIINRGGYGLTNGLFCAILTIGTLPLWENIFKILTPLKLLELSNPNQPLLKRLLIEAPGTYHHSIIVGNLSERAAEMVGADPLTSRVGSYYHDIGKLNRPYFFKENQIGVDNPHDKLNPKMSTMIITNHVKDGILLGKKYKLPDEIIDIISEHHGDSVVSYFYHKAKQEGSQQAQIEDFRYIGPKPQTKEAAIVMLADSAEAAVRSIKEPDKQSIDEMVKSIIKGKLEDGQLQECDLTLKDLNVIENAFSAVMMGIFHERIEYPSLNLAENKGEA